jgi:hypothetical protein
MSLLSVVTQVALKVGLAQPLAAMTSTDSNILQMVGYANESGQEISARYGWEALTKESSFSCPGAVGGITALSGLVGGSGYASGGTATYGNVPLVEAVLPAAGAGAYATIAVTNGVVTSCTVNTNAQGSNYAPGQTLTVSNTYLGLSGSGFQITVASVAIVPVQTQGVMTTLAGPDFAWVLNDTMWDRTQRRPVFGPKAPAEWQQLQAQYITGPWWQYRIRGGQLLFIPAPQIGDLIYFEWQSKYWAAASTTPTVGYATAYGADTDVSLIDERLVTLDTLWRYKRAKKLEYSEDYDIAEAAITDAMTRNASQPRLNLAGAVGDILPGVFVPAGSWSGTYGAG